ncbi:DMT family transporter [Oricola cellulosilytica]|uniref:DMT family transporter n=1 Tax=Oricola cellulosilytica TaxID=1429082 RepID=A0A4R0P8R7_9HYPH|nr:DMT family transporter [Oricola cellulosilytica]TCD12371.1 DMT family transporter [Oricola cellulosilytica]
MSKAEPSAVKPQLDEHLGGMVICAAGMLIIPLMDAVAKWLAVVEGVSPGQITLARFVVQALLSAPFVIAAAGIGGLWPKRPMFNVMRGAILAIASLLFFLAVKYMPLADAIAVFFVEPLILTVLSVVVLREKVGWRRISAVLVGFTGALIVIQPSFELFGPVSLLPLGTATLFATYLILNRLGGTEDSAMTMQVAAGAGGSLVLLAASGAGTMAGVENLALRLDYPPSIWGLLFLAGAIGMFGHHLILLGFRVAPASLLAPFQYLEIVSAAGAGLLLFGDFPTASKWLGIAMIVGAGLYVFWRENKAARS